MECESAYQHAVVRAVHGGHEGAGGAARAAVSHRELQVQPRAVAGCVGAWISVSRS